MYTNPSRIDTIVRRYRRGLTLALLSSLLAIPQHAATESRTAAPPVRQVAGVYHQALGRLRVTALFDGVVTLPRQQLAGIDRATIDTLLKRGFVPETADGVQTAVNAYLVHDGRQLILVDAGTAACFGPGLGQVLANLRVAGYVPGDVRHVLLTHAHPDHACGLLDRDGRAAFANATVWLARDEADYWLDPGRESRSDTRPLYKPLFRMARDAVAPYLAAGRLRSFDADTPLPDGVSALPSPGHSPGHTSFLFDAGDAGKLLVWGDIVHYHAVQFAQPSAAYEADADRAQAAAARRDLLARSADGRWWLAGAHLPFPGIGHVRRDGDDAYAWVPVEFAPLPVAD